jgi:hypothetical protein
MSGMDFDYDRHGPFVVQVSPGKIRPYFSLREAILFAYGELDRRRSKFAVITSSGFRMGPSDIRLRGAELRLAQAR